MHLARLHTGVLCDFGEPNRPCAAFHSQKDANANFNRLDALTLGAICVNCHADRSSMASFACPDYTSQSSRPISPSPRRDGPSAAEFRCARAVSVWDFIICIEFTHERSFDARQAALQPME
jgi:hypothetical protein